MREPELSSGDRVVLVMDRRTRGRVVRCGPEQCEVRFDGDARDSVVPTSWLASATQRVRSGAR